MSKVLVGQITVKNKTNLQINLSSVYPTKTTIHPSHFPRNDYRQELSLGKTTLPWLGQK